MTGLGTLTRDADAGAGVGTGGANGVASLCVDAEADALRLDFRVMALAASGASALSSLLDSTIEDTGAGGWGSSSADASATFVLRMTSGLDDSTSTRAAPGGAMDPSAATTS